MAIPKVSLGPVRAVWLEIKGQAGITVGNFTVGWLVSQANQAMADSWPPVQKGPVGIAVFQLLELPQLLDVQASWRSAGPLSQLQASDQESQKMASPPCSQREYIPSPPSPPPRRGAPSLKSHRGQFGTFMKLLARPSSASQ